MAQSEGNLWAIVLAGGEGVRLRALVRGRSPSPSAMTPPSPVHGEERQAGRSATIGAAVASRIGCHGAGPVDRRARHRLG
jgi:hypothetical protein